jgi:hypothetical protein
MMNALTKIYEKERLLRRYRSRIANAYSAMGAICEEAWDGGERSENFSLKFTLKFLICEFYKIHCVMVSRKQPF